MLLMDLQMQTIDSIQINPHNLEAGYSRCLFPNVHKYICYTLPPDAVIVDLCEQAGVSDRRAIRALSCSHSVSSCYCQTSSPDSFHKAFTTSLAHSPSSICQKSSTMQDTHKDSTAPLERHTNRGECEVLMQMCSIMKK